MLCDKFGMMNFRCTMNTIGQTFWLTNCFLLI